VQQSRSRRARRNPNPRMTKATVHEKREVNEKRPNPRNSPSHNHDSAAPDNIRSSALVQGRSTQFMANPCRWPQKRSPETRLHFRHFRGLLNRAQRGRGSMVVPVLMWSENTVSCCRKLKRAVWHICSLLLLLSNHKFARGLGPTLHKSPGHRVSNCSTKCGKT